jgi:hypothetical protein
MGLKKGCKGSRTSHGEAKPQSKEYIVWSSMKDRCFNVNSNHYKGYGGRGITVCERWRKSYQNFLEDMGRRPSDKHTLDRIDNDGNYCPENCRWTTMREQTNNTRKNKYVEYKGERLTVAQLRDKYGLNQRIYIYLKRGHSVEEAIAILNSDHFKKGQIRSTPKSKRQIVSF